MRVKLLVLTAFVGAIIGACASLGAVAGILGRRGLVLAKYNYRPDTSVAFVICLILVVFASLSATFVYRHTARRRKFQAALTGALTFVLSVMIFYTAAMFLVQ